MTDTDGFPRELIGAPIKVTNNPNNVIVGKTYLYTGALTGDPIRAWWKNDVVVVECAGAAGSHNYYYYTAANSASGVFLGNEEGCNSAEFRTALECARKYRAEQSGKAGTYQAPADEDDSESESSSDDSATWWKVTKLIFKIIFFPVKAIWWIIKKLC